MLCRRVFVYLWMCERARELFSVYIIFHNHSVSHVSGHDFWQKFRFTSLSTIFHFHTFVWTKKITLQSLMKNQASDTWHNTMPGHITVALDRAVLVLPYKSESQAWYMEERVTFLTTYPVSVSWPGSYPFLLHLIYAQTSSCTVWHNIGWMSQCLRMDPSFF